MISSTSWTRMRYAMIAPVYDFGASFDPERRRAFAKLALRPGERVLLLGVGTGADLPHLPQDVEALGIDVAPAMLARARTRARPGIELRVMDAQALELPDQAFDAVVLHQILEVARDPVRCLREAARVLKSGGRISVFDKFLPPGFRPPLWHRVATGAIDVVFTTANRSFEEILALADASLVVEVEEPCAPLSPFRLILLRKL